MSGPESEESAIEKLSSRSGEDTLAEQALAELVQRAQAGDATALDELITRFQPVLLRIARIRLGARLRRVLESGDIVQDANAVIVGKLEGFEYRGRAATIHWLARIVENKIRDWDDKTRSRKWDLDLEVPLATGRDGEDEEHGAPHPEDSVASPSAAVTRAELREKYDACVQRLLEEDREVILMRDYEGMSWPAICERLGRPNVHATQELHRRATIKLARMLKHRLRGFGTDAD